MRSAWLGLVGVVACGFSPHAAPDATLAADARVDGSAIDGPLVTGDTVDAGSACYGTDGGLIRVCFPMPPAGSRVLDDGDELDTSLQASCPSKQSQADGNVVCVIGLGSLTMMPAATFRVFGNIPLVVVVDGPVTLGGTLDLSTRRLDAAGADGPGADPTDCAAPFAATANNGGGGGGAGGTFGDAGGAGGTGNFGAGNMGGFGSAAAVSTLSLVHGGCAGGGGGSGVGDGGAPGRGGGALYVIATGTIDVQPGARILANGGGGGGGGEAAGGGGGGTGGLIGLDAPAIILDGLLAANGGGGGQGGNDDVGGASGDPGVDGNDVPAQAAGGANASAAGFGGSGAGGGGGAGVGSDAGGGAGGGGGGAGVIFVIGATPSGSGSESPAPTFGSGSGSGSAALSR